MGASSKKGKDKESHKRRHEDSYDGRDAPKEKKHKHKKHHHKDKKRDKSSKYENDSYSKRSHESSDKKRFDSEDSDVVEIIDDPLPAPLPQQTHSKEGKHDTKSEARHESRSDTRHESRSESRYESRSELRHETRSDSRQELRSESRHESRSVEAKYEDRHSKATETKQNVESLSIEETNKLRAKLGMKLLEVSSSSNSSKKKDNNLKKDDLGEFYHKPATNLAKKAQQEKISAKLTEIKEKRMLHNKLNKVKGLGESDSDDDVESWVTKNREIEKAKQEAEKRETYERNYVTFWEEQMRYEIFKDNLEIIKKHNTKFHDGHETHHMGITQFTDMTIVEFKKLLGRQKVEVPQAIPETTFIGLTNVTISKEWDWRLKGAVMEVKDQANCGACWAFSATGALEGQNAIHHDMKIPLSEQQLLDCSGDYGNGDCLVGGDEKAAFAYVKDHGIEAEAVYPYIGDSNKCSSDNSKTLLKITGYKELPGNEEALKQAIATIGPISVAINADEIQLYSGGIYTTHCKSADINHALLAVGYGSETTKNGTIDYWIIKNSWGKNWGEEGYIRFQRNANNLCGIGLESSYPTIK